VVLHKLKYVILSVIRKVYQERLLSVSVVQTRTPLSDNTFHLFVWIWISPDQVEPGALHQQSFQAPYFREIYLCSGYTGAFRPPKAVTICVNVVCSQQMRILPGPL
jgi:hypothetical protein